MSWANIDVLTNQIKHNTGTVSLIKLPNQENKVWISNRCIRDGKNKSALNVGINTDWQYQAVRAKTIKLTISGEEIIKAFSGTDVKEKQAMVLFEDHKPNKINVEGVADVDDDLIR